jgi:hypothetical protein
VNYGIDQFEAVAEMNGIPKAKVLDVPLMENKSSGCPT